MSISELAIRLKKGWITGDNLVQQMGSLQQFRFRVTAKAGHQQKILRVSVEIEGNQIGSWWALDGEFFGDRDFSVKFFGDFLRDVTLDNEDVLRIAIILLRPNVRVGARVD